MLKNSVLSTEQRLRMSGKGLKSDAVYVGSLSLQQKRVLRLWLASQRRRGSSVDDDTEARLQELCAAEGWSPDGSDGEEDKEEEEMDNSETLDDGDVALSDSGRLSGISRQMDSDIYFMFYSYDFSYGF